MRGWLALSLVALFAFGGGSASAASATICGNTGLVCVTAIAAPTVSCATNGGKSHCTAAATPGAAGATSTEFYGWVVWRADICGANFNGGCQDSESITDGFCQWNSGTTKSCSDTETVVLGTYTCTFCTTAGYVSVVTTARARLVFIPPPNHFVYIGNFQVDDTGEITVFDSEWKVWP